MKRKLHLALALLFTLAALAATTLPARALTPEVDGRVIYVDQKATGTPENGSTWTNAYKELSTALTNALEGDEIWVAAGTYYPQDIAGKVPANDRDRTFVIPPGVEVYGGFAGGESSLTARNWAKNQTILSGDIGEKGDNTDNCYHVVIVGLPDGESATLDGFTVTGGNANGDGSVTVENITFGQRFGGGVFARLGSRLTNNTIYGNAATFDGGGVYANGIESNRALLTNNTIYGNTAIRDGGGVCALSATLTNNTIYDNTATTNGGGVWAYFATLTNNILWGNKGGSGEDLYVYSYSSGSDNLIGSMVDEYTRYTSTDDLIGPTYNPYFIDPANGDFRLGIYSAARDVVAEGENLGAWPAVELVPTDGILYINRTVDITGTDYKGNGSSWSDALSDLGEALAFAKEKGGVSRIYVAKGTYIPKYTPGDSDDRYRTFSIPPNVRVYGGFSGTAGETFDARDWAKNQTILSGDIGKVGDNTDNCYTVVKLYDGTLDGFHITGGNGDTGGGVWTDGNVTLINNTIYGNTASNGGGVCATAGGGINSDGVAVLTNNTIYDNTATSNGGGVYAHGATLTGNTIYGNRANEGAGVYASGAATLTNNTICNNTASSGGGVFAYGITTTLNNNILWGNNGANGKDLYVSASASGSHNLIGEIGEGGEYKGTDDDRIGPTYNPRFANPGAYDFRLQEGSPAIDAGDDTLYKGKGYPDTDAAGDDRFKGKAINIGAYETVVPADNAAYHTLTLEVAPGIDCYGLTAGTHQLADGDHLHLQFLADDRTLGPDDVMLLVDGVDTPFTIPAAGSYYGYILNPIHGDHTVLIALREYTVTLPEVEGITFTPGAGVHRVPYGEPFLFYIWAISEGTFKVYANGELLPCSIDENPLRTDQPDEDPSQFFYLVEKVVGPVSITTEGSTTGNPDIVRSTIRLAIDNGQLTIDNEMPHAVNVAVYTITGQTFVQLRELRGSKTLTLPAGVYIVQAGEQRWKVVVN